MIDSHVGPRPSTFRLVAAFLAVYVIWGSTYLAIALAIKTIPIFIMAGTRFFTAGVLLYAWARWKGAARPTSLHWRNSIIIGGLLLFVSNGGVVFAETRVPSGITALLVATVPVWMVLLTWMRSGGARPGAQVFLGLALGLVGIGLLTIPHEVVGSLRVDPLGAVVLITVSLVWSIGSLFARTAAKPASQLLSAGMQMLCAGGLHGIASIVTGEWTAHSLTDVSMQSALAMLYLLVFGSIVGFTAYMWLLRVTTPARVATYAYVNPVVAVLLGWAFGGEALTGRTAIAAAIIVTAVVFITTADARPTKRPAPLPALADEPPDAAEAEPEDECLVAGRRS